MADARRRAAAADAWQNDPIWQKARENVEQLTAPRDWAEQFFATGVAFEPLVCELFRSEFVMQVAALHGDFATPTLVGAGEADVSRRRCSRCSSRTRSTATRTARRCRAGWRSGRRRASRRAASCSRSGRRSPRRRSGSRIRSSTPGGFEEIMSTHYGRMVVLDDRVLLFADPEDAEEYIGFDLQPVE